MTIMVVVVVVGRGDPNCSFLFSFPRAHSLCGGSSWRGSCWEEGVGGVGEKVKDAIGAVPIVATTPMEWP